MAFRLVSSVGLEKYLGILLWRFNLSKNTIQIPRQTKIGYGLYIGHETCGVVCNSTAIIESNCNLSQWVTIDSNVGHSALIGDNVYIESGICIVENVKIGDNVTIDAGSIVTKDIPSNASVVENYARVLNYRDFGRYIQNRWGTI